MPTVIGHHDVKDTEHWLGIDDRRERIRPYDEFTPAVSASAYCLADLLPCRGFRIWGDGVFQIKNQPISRQRFGFFQSPPVRPR